MVTFFSSSWVPIDLEMDRSLELLKWNHLRCDEGITLWNSKKTFYFFGTQHPCNPYGRPYGKFALAISSKVDPSNNNAYPPPFFWLIMEITTPAHKN